MTDGARSSSKLGISRGSWHNVAPPPESSDSETASKISEVGPKTIEKRPANSASEPSEPKVFVSSKHRGKHARRDIVKGMGGGLWILVDKVVSLWRMVFPKQTPVARSLFTPRPGVERTNSHKSATLLQTAGTSAIENLFDKDKDWTAFIGPNGEVDQPGMYPHLEQAVVTLRASVEAVKEVVGDDKEGLARFKGEFGIVKLQVVLRGAGADSPDPAIAKEIKKAFQEAIRVYSLKSGKKPKDLLKAFESSYVKARGRNASKSLSMTHEMTLRKEGETAKFTEKMEVIGTAYGADYLVQRTDNDRDYRDQITDARDNTGIRPSARRTETEAQGTSVNLHRHLITDSGDNTLETIYRGGAFAIHGQGKTGIDRLKLIKEMPEGKKKTAALKKLHKQWKHLPGVTTPFNETAMMGMLESEITRRTDLAVAQALPKVLAAIEDIAKDPVALASAIASKSFLYTEQSFVSDQDAKERMMLEDSKGALDYISDKLEIKFGDPTGLVVGNGGTITVTLAVREGEGEPLPPLKVQALLFAQGVNEKQSLGKLIGGSSYQDDLNKIGLEKMLKYANEKDWDPITDLATHFSAGGNRPGKDITGVKLIANATKALGGRRGIHCKSGKDRTGAEANSELGRAIAHSVFDVPPNTGMLKGEEWNADRLSHYREKREEYKDQLAGGLSQHNVFRNNEMFKYAFNPFQWATLPEGWRPPAEFCGDGPS